MNDERRGWEIVDEGSAENQAAGPGARLKAAREQAGWTLEAFAAELKLPPRRLAELEADEFASFGPAVFVRGYLRRCAVLLGLHAEEILALYEARVGEAGAAVEIGLPPGRPPRPDRSGWLRPLAIAAVVVAVLAGGWWFFAPSPGIQAPAAKRVPEGAGAPLALEPPGPQPSKASPDAVEERPVEVVRTEPEPMELQETDESGGQSQPEPDEAAATVADSLAAAPPAEPEPTAAPVVQAGQADIRIRLLEDCWLEIIDAEGRRLAYRLGRAGEVTRVRGTAPVSVFLGNAEGVELTVDGEPVAVRPAARRDGTARLTVGGGAG